MTIDEKNQVLAEVWKIAADALAVRIEAPYTLIGADGTEAIVSPSCLILGVRMGL